VRRPGFTLIELLVVIGLLVLLAALTAVLFPAVQGRQQVESGASSLSGWLLIAKQQARRDGVPTGVRLIPDTNGDGFVRQLQYIQQPDDFAVGSYTGQFNGNPYQAQFSGVSFADPTTGAPTVYSIPGSPQEPFQVQAGDYLEIYGGGVVRRTSGIGSPPNTNTLTFDSSVSAPLPPASPPTGNGGSNYRIIPQPRPLTGDTPLTFPTNVAIDLNPHPLLNNAPLSQNIPQRNSNIGPVYEILFAPSGAVVGQGTGTGQIYLWVRDSTADNSSDIQAGRATLICVQTRTGFIAAHPVAPYQPGSNPPTGGQYDPYLFTRDGSSSGM
jgi:prepilin-type N-terminal cleavage/methylation domain-containing protein